MKVYKTDYKETLKRLDSYLIRCRFILIDFMKFIDNIYHSKCINCLLYLISLSPFLQVRTTLVISGHEVHSNQVTL